MNGWLAGEFLVAVGDVVPVDDVEEGGDVVGAAVLVFQIIGVFPDVDAEEWRVGGTAGSSCADGDGGVLIGGGEDGEFFIGTHHEPGPTAAESGEGGFGEFVFEVGEVLEIFIDGLGEFAFGFTAAVFAYHLPEEGMVVVATAVVLDGGADGFGKGVEVFQEFFERFLFEVVVAGEGFVEVGDVGTVVFVVVDLHGLRVDVGFEGIEGVGERREGEGRGAGGDVGERGGVGSECRENCGTGGGGDGGGFESVASCHHK
jgi:hypothetical protein